MARADPKDVIYRRRRFDSDVIELCVRWYLTYRLSYRDLVAMMADRGIAVTHTTIMRWVFRYVPEYERRWSRFARPVGTSWRMDETAVSIKGRPHYVYRAVDKAGKSVHSMLSDVRSVRAAQAFFQRSVNVAGTGWPSKINLDKYPASHRALKLLGEEDTRWRSVRVRDRRYLNNVIEQDHRAIKRRCAPMLGFKSMNQAAVTLAGIELAHRIRKRRRPPAFEWQDRLESNPGVVKSDRLLGPSFPRVCDPHARSCEILQIACRYHEAMCGGDCGDGAIGEVHGVSRGLCLGVQGAKGRSSICTKFQQPPLKQRKQVPGHGLLELCASLAGGQLCHASPEFGHCDSRQVKRLGSLAVEPCQNVLIGQWPERL